MPDPIDLTDGIKQVDDHAECEWLLEHLDHRDAVLLWDHYAEGIPVRTLARREGMTVSSVLLVLNRSCRRLQGVIRLGLYTADE